MGKKRISSNLQKILILWKDKTKMSIGLRPQSLPPLSSLTCWPTPTGTSWDLSFLVVCFRNSIGEMLRHNLPQ